jgi:hypothetical protein
MMTQSGLFNLRTPHDLLAKAKHDLSRLRSNPISSYAAFDFFTAVRHLPDWLHPTDKTASERIFASYVELRIARHLADHGKHFFASHRQHAQVSDTTGATPAFAPGVFGNLFHAGKLLVDLDPADAATATISSPIEVLPLAERVFLVAETIVV